MKAKEMDRVYITTPEPTNKSINPSIGWFN